VYQEYAHHGFQILAVNPYDPMEAIIEVRDDPSLHPTFQLLQDPAHQVEGLYSVTLYPTNIIVDGSGEIRYRIGHTTAAELRSMLQEVYGFAP
jgi:peroxiredoxin